MHPPFSVALFLMNLHEESEIPGLSGMYMEPPLSCAKLSVNWQSVNWISKSIVGMVDVYTVLIEPPNLLDEHPMNWQSVNLRVCVLADVNSTKIAPPAVFALFPVNMHELIVCSPVGLL